MSDKYNVAIKPINTSYAKDDAGVNNLQNQLLLFDFTGTITTPPARAASPMQMFTMLIEQCNTYFGNAMRLMPMFMPVDNLGIADIQAKAREDIERNKPVKLDNAFETMVEFVLKDEGGYVNHPKDPGGSTNMGVTQKTYDWYCQLNKIPTKDVKDLTKEEAKQVYYQLFWEKSGADEIAESGNAQLAYVVFDTAIHSGIGRAKRLLKESGGDADKMLEKRLSFLKGRSAWKTFGEGWTNRIAKISERIDNLGEQKEYLA